MPVRRAKDTSVGTADRQHQMTFLKENDLVLLDQTKKVVMGFLKILVRHRLPWRRQSRRRRPRRIIRQYSRAMVLPSVLFRQKVRSRGPAEAQVRAHVIERRQSRPVFRQ